MTILEIGISFLTMRSMPLQKLVPISFQYPDPVYKVSEFRQFVLH
jgi:hypothetical protein